MIGSRLRGPGCISAEITTRTSAPLIEALATAVVVPSVVMIDNAKVTTIIASEVARRSRPGTKQITASAAKNPPISCGSDTNVRYLSTVSMTRGGEAGLLLSDVRSVHRGIAVHC